MNILKNSLQLRLICLKNILFLILQWQSLIHCTLNGRAQDQAYNRTYALGILCLQKKSVVK